MKICPQCQAGPFADMKELVFCVKCGARLAHCPKCKKCGTQILPGDIYCMGCGLSRGQALIASMSPTDEPFVL